jgi:hypothetical protein
MSLPDPKFDDYPLDLTRLLTTLYQDLEHQIARADMKANLILAANSVLIAGAVNVAVNYLREADELRHSWLLLLSLLPAVLMSALAVYHALSVAYPRHAHGFAGTASGELFASPRIAAQSAEAFGAAFLGAGMQQIKRHMLASVHAKASILQVKFRHVRFGIYATIAAFLGWLGFLVFIAMRA